MPSIEVNGIALHHVDEGPRNGPVVVFSHGLLWSHRMFRPQIDALKDRFRCVAWDHRGQGQSEVPPGRIATIEECTADAIALIEGLSLGPVHFVGLSMGGFVGQRLAARRPDLVTTLTLLETAADPEPRANLPKYRLLNTVARLGGLPLVAGRVMPIMFGATFLRDASRAELRTEWHHELLRNKRTIYKAVNGVLERASCEHELHAIQAPTQVIWGAEDKAIAEPRARALAAGIPGATFVRLERGGHTATIEEPEAVNRALEAFLEG